MPIGRRRTVTRSLLGCLALLGTSTACVDGETPQRVAQALQPGAGRPDEKPRLLNAQPPFHYPAALYARKVQGNVTLRLYIDRDGLPRADSTRIEESSGYPGLDSAAVKGSQDLRFAPAKLRGEAMPVSILYPVYFRHPEAPALPGDTILNRAQGPARSGAE
jgi:protein TonB